MIYSKQLKMLDLLVLLLLRTTRRLVHLPWPDVVLFLLMLWLLRPWNPFDILVNCELVDL